MGKTPIAKIKINLKSRDDIPPLLLGLQYIYTTVALRHKVFAILEEQINPGTDKKNGRPGMELWTVLVLGVMELIYREMAQTLLLLRLLQQISEKCQETIAMATLPRR